VTIFIKEPNASFHQAKTSINLKVKPNHISPEMRVGYFRQIRLSSTALAQPSFDYSRARIDRKRYICVILIHSLPISKLNRAKAWQLDSAGKPKPFFGVSFSSHVTFRSG
jgi:hypothetical protein